LIKIIATALMIGISLGVGLTSCSSNKSPRQAESKIEPREPPVPLQPTKENKGQRCEARYYFGVHTEEIVEPDEGYSPYCYKLQLRLNQAIRVGDLSEIRESLKYGANPNLPVHNGRVEVVRLLLDNGADVNGGTFIIGTPLVVAAGEGHTEVVRLLLERGADICFKADGGTAEEFARKRGHQDIVDLLQAAKSKRCE
jgi:hypothetical protein